MVLTRIRERPRVAISGAFCNSSSPSFLTPGDSSCEDGQHRLYGLEHAFAKDSVESAKDYLLPVTIVEGIDSYEEMRHFHIINTRHKGVPTDVVDRHLLTMWEQEGSAILEKEGDRNYLRARGAKLCDLLRNTPDSPWYQKVRIAGYPLVRETGAKYMRALGEYLRERLPRLVLPRL